MSTLLEIYENSLQPFCYCFLSFVLGPVLFISLRSGLSLCMPGTKHRTHDWLHKKIIVFCFLTAFTFVSSFDSLIFARTSSECCCLFQTSFLYFFCNTFVGIICAFSFRFIIFFELVTGSVIWLSTGFTFGWCSSSWNLIYFGVLFPYILVCHTSCNYNICTDRIK